MNWRYNSAQSHRLFARRAAVILSLFISVMHVQAQTQATMNAQARAEFERKESQRGWLAFRDAEAAFAADQLRGGSMAPTIRYETMAELT